MLMKEHGDYVSVVCFGDSNTFGHNPLNGERFSDEIRWPCVMQRILGSGYKVIEEGLNGRTTVFEDPNDDWKNGIDYIRGILCSHRPVDILVIMLGTNDMKTVYHASPEEIASGMESIVVSAQDVMEKKQGYAPKIIVVSPPLIGEDIENGPFGESITVEAREKSKKLAPLYKALADKHGSLFLNAADHIKASKVDNLHLDPVSHGILAEKIAGIITPV